MDGHALELDDDSFDIAGSQFGVMLFPDMPKGIREMARVVKPGGRVLMNVYGDPHEIEFLGFFIAAVQSVVPAFEGPPMDPPPLPSSCRSRAAAPGARGGRAQRRRRRDHHRDARVQVRRAPVGLAGAQQSDRRARSSPSST